jgi:hypothetical protein
LHAGRFNPNQSRGFHRLRHCDYLNRDLSTGFEEVGLVQHRIIPIVGKNMFQKGKIFFETLCPQCLKPLLIPIERISCSSRAVFRDDLAAVNLTIYRRENITEEQRSEAFVVSERLAVEDRHGLETLDVLLTLNEPLKCSRNTLRGALVFDALEHQRKLTNTANREDIRSIK